MNRQRLVDGSWLSVLERRAPDPEDAIQATEGRFEATLRPYSEL